MYGSYGATAPAPIPYSKQTDQFLIGIINKFAPQLKEISAKLEDPRTSAADKTKLKTQQSSILTSYWNPAKTELTKRGYSITVTAAKELKIISPTKANVPSSIPVTSATSSKSGISPAMIGLIAVAAGAYWWFKIRKPTAVVAVEGE